MASWFLPAAWLNEPRRSPADQYEVVRKFYERIRRCRTGTGSVGQEVKTEISWPVPENDDVLSCSFRVIRGSSRFLIDTVKNSDYSRLEAGVARRPNAVGNELL